MRFIFDVESNGLHGEGFAVGWVLQSGSEVISSGYLRCTIEGPIDPWVAENVAPHLDPVNCTTARSLRSMFWDAWIEAKNQGATAWADCGFPVESSFLSACVADQSIDRKWEAPYPLHEIATVFVCNNIDPTIKFDRLEDETPHHPTGDARQSARLLQQYLPEKE